MLSKISHAIQRFNNKFTYRQRFVFFSLVFIITTPLPGYWMLKTQNFFIKRAHWQSVGDRFQNLIGSLHYDVNLHRLSDLSLPGENALQPQDLYILHESVKQKLKRLDKLNEATDFLVYPSLGKGFSSLPTNMVELKKIRNLWNEAAEVTLEIGEPIVNYSALLTELEQMLKEIGHVFQLNVAPTLPQQIFIHSTLSSIPKIQTLIVDLVLLDYFQKINEDSSKKWSVNRFRITDQLREALSGLKQSLLLAYDSSDLTSQRNALLSAKRAFADYQADIERFLLTLEQDNKISATLAVRALESGEATRDFNVELADGLFLLQLSAMQFKRNLSVFVYMSVALTLVFYIIFRVLTRHLKEIYFHLQSLSRGEFSTCFCSHFKDEFGLMGRTFDKMGASVHKVLQELNKLGMQLTESINQITKTTKEQEENVLQQENQVEDIEMIAKAIADDSRTLADTMNSLSKTAISNSLADSTKEGLDRMQTKMTSLSSDSTDIINALSTLHEKISSANILIDFMTKVSNQAGLISLNSAIETANLDEEKLNFGKITNETQRFAEKTAISTQDIEVVISEILDSVEGVKLEANSCLGEIDQGVHRLIGISHQLSSITIQGKEQIKKFEEVNDVMQMQALAAENIISSLSNLSETAKENSASIRVLHQSIADLGKTTKEMKKAIGVFG